MNTVRKISSTGQLTPTQEAALRALSMYKDQHGVAPTVQELADVLEIQPPSAYELLVRLQEKGYIQREPRKARTVTIVKSYNPRVRQMVEVPVVGKVAAGIPILAIENRIGEIMVDAMIVRGTCFALEVTGDSMIDVDINDGDFVVVRQQRLAETGDIVVAMRDGEATVKRLFIADHRIELRPENKRLKPIVISHEDESFAIVGSCHDVPGIEDIRLVELQLQSRGRYNERSTFRSKNLFAGWEERGMDMPRFGNLVSASFQVKFEKSAKPRTIKIKTPNVASFDRKEDAHVIDLWMRARGFIKQQEQTKKDESPSNDVVEQTAVAYA